VRELRNIVIRLTAKHPGQLVSCAELEAELDLLNDIPAPASHKPGPLPQNDESIDAAVKRLQQNEAFNLDQMLNKTERAYIDAALKLVNGNVSQAARLLGINRTTLYNRMESFSKEQ
jgi:two-component system nitrogen regulation response regulator GlnG